MVHKLKIRDEYLENLKTGIKKVEIRLNDRDYQRGDVLEFTEYRLSEAVKVRFVVTHIHSGLGMEGNYVALSVESGEGKTP